MSNRLAQETSPYLLQHANNPVDWYPWGPEAHARARTERKPIFLSIGYAACHWCHVMEHESFEDAEIARLLNEYFVSIKVDREERPDLDQIYMHAVQMIAGRGGWPMSVFLTPDLKPFYGGTYWPPRDSRGMPGFERILHAVLEAWQQRPEQVAETAANLTEGVRRLERWSEPPADALELELLMHAAAALERSFDHQHGGFGDAPKFPHPMDLRVLLRVWQRSGRDGVLEMVTRTLEHMAAGGIYDHLGGGFHRYSVDARWLVPHFEKMLYDNAQLAVCYTETFQATGNEDYATVVRETLDYVLREMTGPEGGFFSTQDADSEGEEGKFYVWSVEEVRTLLGDDAKHFMYVYDVSPEGNFEGHNILNRPKTFEQCAKILHVEETVLREEMARCRVILLAARNKRVHPGLDDKVLASWNGLMIEAFARAGAALDEPRYVAAAERAAGFLLSALRNERDGLLHSWRTGQAKLAAFLDDYACVANGLTALYETTFHEPWLDAAVALMDEVLGHFHDPAGGLYYTGDRHETLISRQKDVLDSAVPSGNAMAATVLGRLGRLTGRQDFATAAERTLKAAAGFLAQYPTGMGQMLLALDEYLGPATELVFNADPAAADTLAMLKPLRRRFLPRVCLAMRNGGQDPHTKGNSLDATFAGKLDGPQPSLYLCSGSTCQPPDHGSEVVRAALDAFGNQRS